MSRSAKKWEWVILLSASIATIIILTAVVVKCPEEKRRIRTFLPSYIDIDGEQIKDLGVLEAGSQHYASFTITNTGSQKITFRDHIDTSCGCTAASFSKPSLNPGESCELELSLHVANRYSERERVTATVNIAEPEPDAFAVGLAFSSYRKWSLSRGHIKVCKPEGFRSEEQVSLFRHGDTDLTIEEVRKSSDSIDIDLTPFNDENRAMIKIAHSMPSAPSKETESVLIKVSGAEMSEVPIELTYVSLPSVFFTPRGLLINLEQETTFSRELVVESLFETEIVEITSVNRAFSFEYDSLSEMKHRIRFHLDPLLLPEDYYKETISAALKNSDGETVKCELSVSLIRVKTDEKTTNEQILPE